MSCRATRPSRICRPSQTVRRELRLTLRMTDRNVRAITEELERRIQSARLRAPDMMESLDEDMVWNAANHLTRTMGLRARSEILIPMRHALTGRRVNSSTSHRVW